jgi:hypothetical protein
LVRVNHHELPVLSRLVRRAIYDGSRRARSEETSEETPTLSRAQQGRV